MDNSSETPERRLLKALEDFDESKVNWEAVQVMTEVEEEYKEKIGRSKSLLLDALMYYDKGHAKIIKAIENFEPISLDRSDRIRSSNS